jgi:hypothetical protein
MADTTPPGDGVAGERKGQRMPKGKPHLHDNTGVDVVEENGTKPPQDQPTNSKRKNTQADTTTARAKSDDKTNKKAVKPTRTEPQSASADPSTIDKKKDDEELTLQPPADKGEQPTESSGNREAKAKTKMNDLAEPNDLAKQAEKDQPKESGASADGDKKSAPKENVAANGVKDHKQETAVGGASNPAGNSDKAISSQTGTPSSSTAEHSGGTTAAPAEGKAPKDFPLGTVPAATTRPISVESPTAGAAGSQQQTKVWDVEYHQVAQGDTFASISKKFYNSAKYEQALLKYNRDYQPDSGLEQNPPILTPGKKLAVPELQALESQYSDSIPNYKPVPSPATTPGGSESEIRSSTDKTSIATSAVVKVSTQKNSAPAPSYKVIKDNETYYSIARDILSKSTRWSELYHLNGERYEPQRPLPVGTVVLLPSDPRVERTEKQ